MTSVFRIKKGSHVLACNFTTQFYPCSNSYISTLHFTFFIGLHDSKVRKMDTQQKAMNTPNSETSHSQPDLKVDLVCKCRSRCTAKKSSGPCKKAGQLCTSRCHPMNGCANNTSFDPILTSSCIVSDSYVPSTGSQPPILKMQAGIELTATDKQVISGQITMSLVPGKGC